MMRGPLEAAPAASELAPGRSTGGRTVPTGSWKNGLDEQPVCERLIAASCNEPSAFARALGLELPPMVEGADAPLTSEPQASEQLGASTDTEPGEDEQDEPREPERFATAEQLLAVLAPPNPNHAAPLAPQPEPSAKDSVEEAPTFVAQPTQLQGWTTPSAPAPARELGSQTQPAPLAAALPGTGSARRTEQAMRVTVAHEPAIHPTLREQRTVPRAAFAQLEALGLPVELRAVAVGGEPPRAGRADAPLAHSAVVRAEGPKDLLRPAVATVSVAEPAAEPAARPPAPAPDTPSPTSQSNHAEPLPRQTRSKAFDSPSAKHVDGWIDSLREPLIRPPVDTAAPEAREDRTASATTEPLLVDASAPATFVAPQERPATELALAKAPDAPDLRPGEQATRQKRQEDAEAAVNRMTLDHGVEARTTTQELGTVLVKARTHGEQVELTVVAERQETSALLTQDRGALLQDLSNNNVSVSSLEIRSAAAGSGQGHGPSGFDTSSRGHGSGSSGRDQGTRGTRGASEEHASQPVISPVSRAAGRRVRIVL